MILDDIIARTRTRIEDLPASSQSSRGEGPVKGRIEDAIQSAGHCNAVIAEIKFASPSSGRIRAEDRLGELASAMEHGGAAALSVLTEPYWFGGRLENMQIVRKMTDLPLLRKDFIIDERQILESREAGADAVLLIASILGDRLPMFARTCRENAIEPFIEIHSRGEIPLALASGATLVGINNRDLRTMKTNLSTTRIVSESMCRDGMTIVSMSGICWPYDVRYLKKYCDGFLVGSSVMASEDPRKIVKEFVCA